MIMKFLAIAIVFCHGCVSAILAAEGQESPITLEEARDALKVLKITVPESTSPEDGPTEKSEPSDHTPAK